MSIDLNVLAFYVADEMFHNRSTIKFGTISQKFGCTFDQAQEIAEILERVVPGCFVKEVPTKDRRTWGLKIKFGSMPVEKTLTVFVASGSIEKYNSLYNRELAERERVRQMEIKNLELNILSAEETLKLAKEANEIAHAGNDIAREANAISEKANEKADIANTQSLTAEGQARRANQIAIAAVIVAAIAVIISIFKD